jgi:hypothetical protein
MNEETLPAPVVSGNIPEIIKEGKTPSFYITGFVTGYSLTEVHLLFHEHGKNSCLVQLSFPVAKSLTNALNTILKNYEEKIGATIPSVEDLNQKMLNKK